MFLVSPTLTASKAGPDSRHCETGLSCMNRTHPQATRQPATLILVYSDFLKRDDQILALRLQNEEARNRMTKAARDKDRALANAGPNGVADPDVDMGADGEAEDGVEIEAFGSKTIVIHPGSQNLRLGLATDALPKTVPMAVSYTHLTLPTIYSV